MSEKLNNIKKNGVSWDSQIRLVAEFIGDVLDKIDEIDAEKIANDAITADEMPEKNKYELEEYLSRIQNGDISPLYRRELKNKVRTQVLGLISTLNEIEKIKIKGRRGDVSMTIASFIKQSDDEKVEYIMKILKGLVTLENGAYNKLEDLEAKYNDIAKKIGDIFREGKIIDEDGDTTIETKASPLKEIMAPGFVKPCVLKAAGFLVMLVHAEKTGEKQISDALKKSVDINMDDLYNGKIHQAEVKKVAKLL